MGGRGASSSVGKAGGGNVTVLSTDSLISQREGNRAEVDQTLGVLRDIHDRYGIDVEDAQLARLSAADAGVMAYYDANGNLAVNMAYFNSDIMNATYDKSVADGYHPGKGNKTGMEAVVAHEMGHRLTDAAAGGWSGLDSTADKIVAEAAKKLGYKNTASLTSKVSGYAKQNSAEAVAEAFADVYCNGNKASKASRAIVAELNKYFGIN